MIRGTGAEAIASDVEEAISTGALAPGAELPPIRELAAQLGINANTVGRGLPPAARTRRRRDGGPARHPGAGPASDHTTLAAGHRRSPGRARPVQR